jgi:hypothetical protein
MGTNILEKSAASIFKIAENGSSKMWYGKLMLVRLQLIWMSDNPDQNMTNKKCCSQLNIYFKRHMAFKNADELLVCSDKT